MNGEGVNFLSPCPQDSAASSSKEGCPPKETTVPDFLGTYFGDQFRVRSIFRQAVLVWQPHFTKR